eukprot:3717447-Lingulodinium_polyedra.AAC.1
MARRGMILASHGTARYATACCWHGLACWRGLARRGHGTAWHGMPLERFGVARRGMAWHGAAR